MRLVPLLALLLCATGIVSAQAPTGIPKFPMPSSSVDLEGPARPGEYLSSFEACLKRQSTTGLSEPRSCRRRLLNLGGLPSLRCCTSAELFGSLSTTGL